MATVNRLTAKLIANLSERGNYPDGRNLYLQVSAFGTKSWLFRYTLDGSTHWMGLGSLLDISLADARRKRDELRLKLLEGVCPLSERREQRALRRATKVRSKTFFECATELIKAKESGWKNEKHAAQWYATFEETKRGTKVFPAATQLINNLPVSEIDTPEILKVLEPIWTTKTETASRVRGRIEAVLDWARVAGLRTGDNPARWSGHLEYLLAKKSKVVTVEHHDAIPYSELPAFMSELRERESVSARALEFLILTIGRTGEIIGGQLDEITEEVVKDPNTEVEQKITFWTVPAERMKAKKEHRVPLCDRAIEILQNVPREAGNPYLFPGAKEGQGLSNMAMLELLRGMRGRGATVHGLRSSFRDWAAETTHYPNEILEMALAHTIGNKAEAAYRRGDLVMKRARLMDEWSRYCAGKPRRKADNVTPIRQAVS